MRKNLLIGMPVLLVTLTLVACGGSDPGDTVTAKDSYGASPALPEPQHSKIPTVNVASAVGWPAGAKPKAADGMAVTAFATGLDHPRAVYVLPNGDVLVAESDTPANPQAKLGIRGWIAKQFRKWAGADTPSANRITLLRDTDGDGRADVRSVFIKG